MAEQLNEEIGNKYVKGLFTFSIALDIEIQNERVGVDAFVTF